MVMQSPSPSSSVFPQPTLGSPDAISPPTALQVLGNMALLLLLALALNAVQAFLVPWVAAHLPQLGDSKANMGYALTTLTHVATLWLVTPTQIEVRWWQRLLLASMGCLAFVGAVAYAIVVPLLRARRLRLPTSV
jgi:hypothetical protein